MKLSREEALSFAKNAAQKEAGHRGADEWDTLAFEDEALSVVNALFDSLGDRSASSSFNSVNEWHHRDPLVDTYTDWRHLGISRDDLIAASERYLHLPWMADDRLDWLVVDVLMWAEIVALFDFVLLQSRSVLLYAAQRSTSGSSLVVAWGWEAVKWGVWLWVSREVLTAGSVAFVAWLITTVAFWFNKRKLSRKASKVCGEMYRCYVVTEAGSFSWDVLWDELRRTRQLGAVWDGVLYKLVEARRGAVSLP